MLLKFTLSNYRSFKNASALELEARSIKEHVENVSVSKFGTQSMGVLKSITLLGANASGKSNLFKGFDLMRYMVIYSANETAFTKTYRIEPFKLNTETEHQPTTFECAMIINNTAYRYGYACNNKGIMAEWLYLRKKRREEKVFIRTKNDYEIAKHLPPQFKNKLQMLTELTRRDTLYISVLTQFNIDIAIEISDWFEKNAVYADPAMEDAVSCTAELLADPVYSLLLNEIIKKCDLGFTDIKKQRTKQVNHNPNLWGNLQPEMKLKASHIKYDAWNKPINEIFFDFNKDESSGARKLIGILGPMTKALMDGGIFWIDDLDAKIHPHIIALVMGLFNSDRYNQKGAQLIAISYNQEILKKLRRDQIVFLDKDMYGASSISALYDYKPQVRKNTAYDKEYLQGLYGGIPNINAAHCAPPEHLKEKVKLVPIKNGHSHHH